MGDAQGTVVDRYQTRTVVLLVDDDADIAEIVESILVDEGHDVIVLPDRNLKTVLADDVRRSACGSMTGSPGPPGSPRC